MPRSTTPTVDYIDDNHILVDGEKYIRYSAIYNEVTRGMYLECIASDVDGVHDAEIVLLVSTNRHERWNTLIMVSDISTRIGTSVDLPKEIARSTSCFRAISHDDVHKAIIDAD